MWRRKTSAARPHDNLALLEAAHALEVAQTALAFRRGPPGGMATGGMSTGHSTAGNSRVAGCHCLALNQRVDIVLFKPGFAQHITGVLPELRRQAVYVRR